MSQYNFFALREESSRTCDNLTVQCGFDPYLLISIMHHCEHIVAVIGWCHQVWTPDTFCDTHLHDSLNCTVESPMPRGKKD